MLATLVVICSVAIIVDFCISPERKQKFKEKVGWWWLVLEDSSQFDITSGVVKTAVKTVSYVSRGSIFSLRFIAIQIIVITSVLALSFCAVSVIWYSDTKVEIADLWNAPVAVENMEGRFLRFGYVRTYSLAVYDYILVLLQNFLPYSMIAGLISNMLTFVAIRIMERSSTIIILGLSTLLALLILFSLSSLTYIAGIAGFYHEIIERASSYFGWYTIPDLGTKMAAIFVQPMTEVIQATLRSLFNWDQAVWGLITLVVDQNDGNVTFLFFEKTLYSLPIPLNQSSILLGGFSQFFSMGVASHAIFLTIVLISVSPLLVLLFIMALLMFTKLLSPILKPLTTFLAKRLYSDSRPVLTVSAVLITALVALTEQFVP